MPERKKGSRAAVRGSGKNMSGPFARYDHDTLSWRTLQPSLTEDSTLFSGTWPKSGTMRSGVVSAQQTWVPHTSERGFGSWPTPTTRDYKGESGSGRQAARGNPKDTLANAVAQWTTPPMVLATATPSASEDAAGTVNGKMQNMLTHQAKRWATGTTLLPSKDVTEPSDSSPVKQRKKGLNPRFGLWLMGYPAKWLDSVESGTPSSRNVRLKSSAASTDDTPPG